MLNSFQHLMCVQGPETSGILYGHSPVSENRNEYSRRLTSDRFELKEFQDSSGRHPIFPLLIAIRRGENILMNISEFRYSGEVKYLNLCRLSDLTRIVNPQRLCVSSTILPSPVPQARGKSYLSFRTAEALCGHAELVSVSKIKRFRTKFGMTEMDCHAELVSASHYYRP